MLGVAFRIHEDNEESVKENLIERETGYNIIKTTFYPCKQMETDEDNRIELEIFVADETVYTYLGPAPEEDIAWQIYNAHVRTCLFTNI